MDDYKLEWGQTLHVPHEEVEFAFNFNLRGIQNRLKVNINIPLKRKVRELVYRLIASHSIPCYLHDELYNTLNSFVIQRTKEFQAKMDERLSETLNIQGAKERLIKEWSSAYTHNEKEHQTSFASVDNAWADVYHALIHSPALDALLRLEHSYSVAMNDMVQQRDDALKELRDKQVVEMEELVSYVGTMKTDEDVNNLAAKQLDESQMQEIYWSSALSELQETQKREYREWVFTVHEKTIADDSCKDVKPTPRLVRSPSMESYQMNYDVTSPQEHFMEESFTIHLGNQMKSMHNIRLVCRDMLDYCQCKTTFIGGSMVPQPQRLQTAMTLYSESLSALILLVDDRLHTSTGIKKRFKQVCNESTDFHFPDFEKQICLIEQGLQHRPTRTRTMRSSSIHAREPPAKNKNLQTGDFYITKHSNLAEVHAVFHLVTDESVASSTINSRHAVIAGVRNIMLAAARHNITNVTIPLLLVHEMGENLTVQWCMKRAELVFKCVKGFTMESLSWDGHDSRTLQFVVPPGISEDMFAAFSNMLPSIFRVSTTLDLSNISAK